MTSQKAVLNTPGYYHHDSTSVIHVSQVNS